MEYKALDEEKQAPSPIISSDPYTDPISEDKGAQSFFQIGRDFQSSDVAHRFTPAELLRLKQFESLEYRKPQNLIYKEAMSRLPKQSNIKAWFVFFLVGIGVAIVAFLLRQSIELLAETRIELVNHLIDDGKWLQAVLYCYSHSIGLTLVATAVIVFIRPSAGGSGVPEVMGYLNGIHIPKIFSLHTLAAKFVSCVCAVGSGLPVGPEGPMIHLGALVGQGVSQGRSKALGGTLGFFARFRNPQDRRDFLTAGAAAGVAAAFQAPVGGFLFALEEVASFWSQRLTWMIFFCCITTAFMMNLLMSMFNGWKLNGRFGGFAESFVLFQVDSTVSLNMAAVIPTIPIGIIGGALGSLFTFVNVKIVRWRNGWMSREKDDASTRRRKKFLALLEPCIVIALFTALNLFLPRLFHCQTPPKPTGDAFSNLRNTSALEHLVHYGCKGNHSYNPMATLTLNSGDEVIRLLFSRNNAGTFTVGSLAAFLAIYFVFACYSSGMALASGFVLPSLLVGATMGRLVGLAVHDRFGQQTVGTWMDPGVLALIGAGSFFGGVTRMTVALTVIMLELSNDLGILLPTMVGIMISKWVADLTTHSLYHALLEVKCVPYLEHTPIMQKHLLECLEAGHVMNAPAVVVPIKIKISEVLKVLQKPGQKHNAFPVVVSSGLSLPPSSTGAPQQPLMVYRGLITRDQIDLLLSQPQCFSSSESEPCKRLTFAEWQVMEAEHYLRRNKGDGYIPWRIGPGDLERFVDFEPYVDTTAPTVGQHVGLFYTYEFFRSQGLRHLTVVDETNSVRGMITRKDLLAFNMEDKLTKFKDALNKDKDRRDSLDQHSFAEQIDGDADTLFAPAPSSIAPMPAAFSGHGLSSMAAGVGSRSVRGEPRPELARMPPPRRGSQTQQSSTEERIFSPQPAPTPISHSSVARTRSPGPLQQPQRNLEQSMFEAPSEPGAAGKGTTSKRII